MLRRTLVLAIVAMLALPAVAGADSISYVKDGNVWLSTSDGARQVQVTSRGGYSDASQADDGTLIALNGLRLHRLDRAGNVLADFDTPVSDTRPPGSRAFFGPFEPAVSPDGTKVACRDQPGARLLPSAVRDQGHAPRAWGTRTPTARPRGTSWAG